MLVLTRKAGETIVIDGCISVSVTAIDRNKVRIGISAPPDVRVDRAEVRERMQEFSFELPEEAMALVEA
jgi:carbon storage regulator